MKLLDANPSPRITGLEELPGKTHYLLGSDAAKNAQLIGQPR